MKRILSSILTIAMLLTALPAMALPNPIVVYESALQVMSQTDVMLPLPTQAEDAVFSVIGNTLGQAQFTHGGATYTLRQEVASEFRDISGVYEDFATPLELQALPQQYECTGYYDEKGAVAWWFDTARSASGSLYSADADGADFVTVLREIIDSLERGAGYAGSAFYGAGGFALEYPLLLADDEAMTEKYTARLLQALDAITGAYASTAVYTPQSLSFCFYDKLFSIAWQGDISVPDAPYPTAATFTAHIDCATGELAPLRAVLDTEALAETTFPGFNELFLPRDMAETELNEAQLDYLNGMDMDTWKDLLSRADFPTDEGRPPVFSLWHTAKTPDEQEGLYLYVETPHALGDQMVLFIPSTAL